MSYDATDERSISNTPDQHGFVVLGLHVLFLDHLAMFGIKNHRYQMILRVSLPDYAMCQYAADRQTHPTEVYIIGNSRYDLMTLPEIQNGRRIAFIGDVFRGIPDDPNSTPPLIRNVRLQIDRVVYYRPFDFILNYPKYLTYVAFGTSTEVHISHILTKAPDFQHDADLVELPDWFDAPLLESGIDINFPALPYTGKTFCESPFTNTEYEVFVGGQENLPKCLRVGESKYFDTHLLNPDDPCSKTSNPAACEKDPM